MSDYLISSIHNGFQAFSQSLTSNIVSGNFSLPFFIAPSFEIQGETVRTQTGVEAILYAPVVSIEAKFAWEVFSTEFSSVNVTPFAFEFDQSGQLVPTTGSGPYSLPLWQSSPVPLDPSIINYDLSQYKWSESALGVVTHEGGGVFSPVEDVTVLLEVLLIPQEHTDLHAPYMSTGASADVANSHPHSFYMHPVFSNFDDSSQNLGGVLTGIVPWDRYVSSILPDDPSIIMAVLGNTCGQHYTYSVSSTASGMDTEYLGVGDLHDESRNAFDRVVNLTQTSSPLLSGHCEYQVTTYSSVETPSPTMASKNAGTRTAAPTLEPSVSQEGSSGLASNLPSLPIWALCVLSSLLIIRV